MLSIKLQKRKIHIRIIVLLLMPFLGLNLICAQPKGEISDLDKSIVLTQYNLFKKITSHLNQKDLNELTKLRTFNSAIKRNIDSIRNIQINVSAFLESTSENDKNMISLTKLIQNNKNCIRFKAKHHEDMSYFLKEWKDWLQNNKRELNFKKVTFNAINEENIADLIELLSCFKNITSLDLIGNNIGAEGQKALLLFDL